MSHLYTHHFSGTVLNGRLYADDLATFLACLKQFEGQAVDFTIGRHKKEKTQNQLAYFHAVICRIISEHTGYTIDEAKMVLKQELLAPTRFYKDLKGNSHPVYPSLADMDRAAVSRFIDDSIRIAAEHWNLEIPGPERVDL